MQIVTRLCRGWRIGHIALTLTAFIAHLSIGVAARAQPYPAGTSMDDLKETSVRCLTLAIAYEAGNEPRMGKEAVAEVVLNRTLHPAFPKSVCGVIFQGSERATGCQFTFTCDGALRRRLSAGVLEDARKIALKALNGELSPHVDGAVNYHADYVMPRWASKLFRVTQIGAHIFYRAPDRDVSELGRYTGAQQWQDTVDAGFDANVLAAALPGAKRAPSQHAIASRSPATFAPWGLVLSE